MNLSTARNSIGCRCVVKPGEAKYCPLQSCLRVKGAGALDGRVDSTPLCSRVQGKWYDRLTAVLQLSALGPLMFPLLSVGMVLLHVCVRTNQRCSRAAVSPAVRDDESRSRSSLASLHLLGLAVGAAMGHAIGPASGYL